MGIWNSTASVTFLKHAGLDRDISSRNARVIDARPQTSKPLADSDLPPDPLGWPFTLEKWYVDVLSADGSVLLVYLASVAILGIRLARVTVDWFRADGTVIHGDASAREVSRMSGLLRFGPAVVEGDRLSFHTAGLSGDFVFQPRYPPCTLRAPFLRDGRRTLTWSIEVPDADVEGWLSWPGGACRVKRTRLPRSGLV